MSFGKEIREKEFSLLDPKLVPVNHGSYGMPPKVVYDEFRLAMEEDLQFPDRYMLSVQRDEYIEALKVVGKVVNADYRSIVINNNATAGVNTIIRSLAWSPGDLVIVTSVIYDSCENVLRYMEEVFGIKILKVSVDIEKGHDSLVQQFKTLFTENKVKLFMIDLISSMPAYLFPVEEIVKLSKEHGVISLIDGAHGIGQVPIDIGELKPDFFVSNLHKWYYVPRGTAFLYVDPKFHKEIQPLTISHTPTQYDGPDALIEKFFFAASDNYAKLRCVPAAYKFIERVGGQEKVWDYCHSLRDEVIEYLKKRWNTTVLDNGGDLSLANVKIPKHLDVDLPYYEGIRKLAIPDNHYFMIGKYKDFSFWRILFQIYNEFDDYVKAADEIEYLLAKLKLGELSLE